MKKIIATLLALFVFTGTQNAHATTDVELCNSTDRVVRASVLQLSGFSYLSGTWNYKGWYILNPRDCRSVVTSFGGVRSWGYISIETKKTAAELAAERDRERKKRDRKAQRSAEKNRSFYEILKLYLPFGRNKTRRAGRSTSEEPIEIQEWTDMQLTSEQEGQIQSQGVDGLVYVICAPKDNFDLTLSAPPSEMSLCQNNPAAGRIISFTLEYFKRSGSFLRITVTDRGVSTNLRTY